MSSMVVLPLEIREEKNENQQQIKYNENETQ